MGYSNGISHNWHIVDLKQKKTIQVFCVNFDLFFESMFYMRHNRSFFHWIVIDTHIRCDAKPQAIICNHAIPCKLILSLEIESQIFYPKQKLKKLFFGLLLKCETLMKRNIMLFWKSQIKKTKHSIYFCVYFLGELIKWLSFVLLLKLHIYWKKMLLNTNKSL